LASQNPFPLMPPRSTELRLDHFDDYVYKADTSTVLYKYMDALCGTTGAGHLINQIFMARLGGALETIYFNELDYIFSHISFLARSPAESYSWNPLVDMLTSDQWDEVRVKDAWYRDRIQKFFTACTYGGSPEGIRYCVDAALGVDCDIFEIWRYADQFGLDADLGRALTPARNEVVVRPHKMDLDPIEMRLLREMLGKITPIDSIVTVDMGGLAVSTPVKVSAAAADSTYFEVQKVITATPVLATMPPPELLPIDLLPTEQWLFSGDPTLAPYAAFNITQEFGYYYLVGGGKRSPIDTVFYGTLQSRTSKITIIDVSDPNYPGVQSDSVGMSWPQNSWIKNQLSDQLFDYVPITYPSFDFPLKNPIEACRQRIRAAINATPGKFIFVGHTLGAAALSLVYKDLQTGDLKERHPDLLGSLTWGNPQRRQGHSIPGYDPGGHGVDVIARRLPSNIEGLWWDFAIPHDFVTTTERGDEEIYTRMYDWIYNTYSGTPDNYAREIAKLGIVEEYSTSFYETLFGYNRFPRRNRPHWNYASTSPIEGDSRTCFQIMIAQIKKIVKENPPEVSSQVKRESNYEVVNSSGTYTDWIPYEKCDCASNFPGGKWGVHPDTAPALNPDGTRYRFAWTTQQEFVEFEMLRITKLGGIADETHYKMPLQKEATAKMIFVPENAIAYSAPSKETTVSASITYQRGRTYGGELRDQSIFVRA